MWTEEKFKYKLPAVTARILYNAKYIVNGHFIRHNTMHNIHYTVDCLLHCVYCPVNCIPKTAYGGLHTLDTVNCAVNSTLWYAFLVPLFFFNAPLIAVFQVGCPRTLFSHRLGLTHYSYPYSVFPVCQRVTKNEINILWTI